ncbi:unnamed protein product, partial [Adineta steineri]
MIDIAKTRENENKLGIHYVCADGKARSALEQPYDIITAAFYLNYARTYDELRVMIKGIFDNLKDGGTFYSITDNVCSTIEAFN